VLNQIPWTKSRKPKQINLIIPSEKEEQRTAVQWLSLNKILFYPVANGRKATIVEAMELKRLGVRPGVPDLVIPIARKGFHGMYVEMKRKQRGIVSAEQKFWLQALTEQGYYAVVAKGSNHFINLVNDYLGM
jgi:VRR-NUC domain